MAQRSSTVGSGRGRGSSLSRLSYAKAIEVCSDLPIASTFYSFQHYAGLSDFFNHTVPAPTPNGIPDDASESEQRRDEAYVNFYTYTADGTSQKKHAKSWNDLKDNLYTPQCPNVTGTLVFLSGHQPRDWLIAIGERYRIDHEFWRRHLNLERGVGRNGAFTDSSLPSNNTYMLELCATTLGEKSEQRSRGQTSHELLPGLRDAADASMKQYNNALSRNRFRTRHGESVVRQFVLHDLDLFSIEQNISIWVGKEENDGSWIAVIWLDFGRNLSFADNAPWQSGSKPKTAPVHCKPTIQHRPGIVLDRKLSNYGKEHGGAPEFPIMGNDDSAIAQTACLLHRECGRLLDKSVACHDVYYALSGIFRFVASAEAQFLEMTQALLVREMDPATLSKTSSHKPAIMWNLLFNRRALLRHAQKIEQVVEFMEARPELGWSEATDPVKREVAAGMAKLLLKDYRYLLRRAESLLGKYESSVSMLMTAATIDESQRAISQAEGVAKLTILAFFFVPISFTTSIFGMNFTELSEGNRLSIWIWAVTAVVSLAFSFCCLKWFSWRLGSKDPAWAGLGDWMKRPSKGSRPFEV